jgi:phosphoglycolate phosphatase-like HAD superfamily hydrolase
VEVIVALRPLAGVQPFVQLFVIGAMLLARPTLAAAPTGDPLPSWRDGVAKKAIVAFVPRVTRKSSLDYVPPVERIATFDNDGTLSTEKPVPTEAAYTIARVHQLAPQHPEWKTQEPFASVLRGDLKGVMASGEKAIADLVFATHAHMTTTEFTTTVRQWLATARDERTGRPYSTLVYQPMIELIAYLRQNGFKTFIVSGGGVEFLRAWVEGVFGIPPEQVVGSEGKLQLAERDGRLVLIKEPGVELVDDKQGKPIGIENHIGRRPIAAFGNSNGDLQMLEWATQDGGTRFALLVHHDDAEREYDYGRADEERTFDEVHRVAVEKKWTVVSMRRDWRTIYPPYPAPSAASRTDPNSPSGKLAQPAP